MLDIGKMRHRVTIQSPVPNQNPFTTTTSNWTTVGTFWARITVLKGSEKSAQGQQTQMMSHSITMRYPGVNYTISAGYVVLFGTRQFLVLDGIENEEEYNYQLVLLVRELDATQGGLPS